VNLKLNSLGFRARSTFGSVKKCSKAFLFTFLVVGSLLLGTVIILFLAPAPTEKTGLTSIDFLKVEGRIIRNNFGRGERVILRGTNIGGWLIHEPWMSPIYVQDDWTMRKILTDRFGASGRDSLIQIYQDAWFNEADLDKIKNLGMNVIRVPIYYLNLQDENGNWKRNTQGEIDFGRIDWLVNAAGAKGIYVILDLHGAPGSQNGEQHSGRSGPARLFYDNAEGEAYRLQTIEFWGELARHYKDNPAVAGYSLLNEPNGASGPTQWDLYDRIYDAIRAIDPNHMIFIGATWHWWDLPNPAVYGWKNVVYEFHYYQWGADKNFQAQKEFIDWVFAMEKSYLHYNVPVLVGEFTGFALEKTWEYLLEQYNKAGWNWTLWTYKVKSILPSNWGLYYGYPNVPGIKTDSYETLAAETLAAQWSEWGTEISFHANDSLHRIVREALRE